MTDNLRDRIAAVICGMDALHAKQWSLEVADAVIEALNLDVATTYLSADKLRREVCVEGYYTDE